VSSTGCGHAVAIFGYGGARSTAMTTLRSLRDLLAIVPYLLGFHPTDSVVLLALRGRQIVFQVRGDLDPAVPGYLATLVARQDPTSAVVLGYGSGAAVTPVVLGARAAVESAGVPVLDVLRVADGRYWSYLCDEPSCCPPEGRPYDPAASPVTTEAVVAGYVALPSREALARRLDPVAGAERTAMGEATGRARKRLGGTRDVVRAGRAAVDDAVRRQRVGIRLTDDEVAWLSVVLAHPPVRGYAWESVGGDLGTHVALWTEVLRRGEPELALAPATLLAFAAWRAGEGAIASIALSRALDADQTDPMAALVARALSGGLTPAQWAVG
jgi:uncharacterized protein DUF4192